MEQKNVVTISRYWHNPQIMTVVWGDGISLSVSLDDFKKILRTEIGEIQLKTEKKFGFIKETKVEDFGAQFETAFTNALAKIKEESLKSI